MKPPEDIGPEPAPRPSVQTPERAGAGTAPPGCTPAAPAPPKGHPSRQGCRSICPPPECQGPPIAAPRSPAGPLRHPLKPSYMLPSVLRFGGAIFPPRPAARSGPPGKAGFTSALHLIVFYMEMPPPASPEGPLRCVSTRILSPCAEAKRPNAKKVAELSSCHFLMVAGGGFEPPTFGL